MAEAFDKIQFNPFAQALFNRSLGTSEKLNAVTEALFFDPKHTAAINIGRLEAFQELKDFLRNERKRRAQDILDRLPSARINDASEEIGRLMRGLENIYPAMAVCAKAAAMAAPKHRTAGAAAGYDEYVAYIEKIAPRTQAASSGVSDRLGTLARIMEDDTGAEECRSAMAAILQKEIHSPPDSPFFDIEVSRPVAVSRAPLRFRPR